MDNIKNFPVIEIMFQPNFNSLIIIAQLCKMKLNSNLAIIIKSFLCNYNFIKILKNNPMVVHYANWYYKILKLRNKNYLELEAGCVYHCFYQLDRDIKLDDISVIYNIPTNKISMIDQHIKEQIRDQRIIQIEKLDRDLLYRLITEIMYTIDKDRLEIYYKYAKMICHTHIIKISLFKVAEIQAALLYTLYTNYYEPKKAKKYLNRILNNGHYNNSDNINKLCETLNFLIMINQIE